MAVTDLSANISSLWRRYKETNDIGLRNELVEVYLPLVKFNASKIKARLPDSVELDDLVSAGVFGLIDAIENFNLSRGVKFETYCVFRIRGAMIDELRTMDWVPRLVRSQYTRYQETVKALSDSNGNGKDRCPTPQEIADYLKIPLSEAEELQTVVNTHCPRFFPIVDIPRDDKKQFNFFGRGFIDSNSLSDPKSLTPEEELSGGNDFLELIACLSNEEQVVTTLYYRDGFEMWRIGKILGLSESRVSQINSKALQKIKDSLLL